MRVALFLLSQKLGRAPKSLLPAGDLCQFHQLLSLVCRQLPTQGAKSLYVHSDIYVFLLLSCDGFIFDTRLMVLGYPRLETLENVMNSERPYSGVNFELQLLSHVPSEMQIGEANVTFAGDVKQK